MIFNGTLPDYVTKTNNGAHPSFNYSPLNGEFDYISALAVYRTHLLNLVIARYEWDLCETLNARALELGLIFNGLCAFADDKKYGFINAPATPLDNINLYFESTEYKLISNTYEENFARDKIVLVYNTPFIMPSINIIEYFVAQLVDIDLSIWLNRKGLRTPYIIEADEETKKNAEIAYKKVRDGSPLIITDKNSNFNIDRLKVLNTNTPYIIDKLQEDKRNTLSTFYTIFGINNVETEKRERLISDEVNANLQSVALGAEIGLACREQACREFNEKFKPTKPISVKMSVGLGVQNGTVYNNFKNSD